MRRIPDIIVGVCVVFGVTAISAGFRWTGGICLSIAAVVLARRRWLMLCIEGMVIQDSAAYPPRNSDTDHVVDSGAYSNSSEGGDEL